MTTRTCPKSRPPAGFGNVERTLRQDEASNLARFLRKPKRAVWAGGDAVWLRACSGYRIFRNLARHGDPSYVVVSPLREPQRPVGPRGDRVRTCTRDAEWVLAGIGRAHV